MRHHKLFLAFCVLLPLTLAACGQAAGPTFQAGQYVYTVADGYPGTTVWDIVRTDGARRVIKDLATGTEQTVDRSQLRALEYIYGAAPILPDAPVPIRQFPRADAPTTGNLTRGPEFVVVNPDLCVARPEVPGSGTSEWCYVVVFNQAEGWVPRSTFGNEWTYLPKKIE